jgi:protein-S-isoprenylcysteine O-methyltransferase Ste14
MKSLGIDVALLVFWLVPHSIFCRPNIKKALGDNPDSVYRSVYCLHASIALALIIWKWQPVWVDVVLWEVSECGDTLIPCMETPALVVYSIYLGAFLWAVTATFATDHFEFFGVVQSTGVDVMKMLGLKAKSTLTARGFALESANSNDFDWRWHYEVCRHPVMLGFVLLFWVQPRMTLNHAFFSGILTLYIFITIPFLQEPEIVAENPGYVAFQQTKPMICPFGCFMGRYRPVQGEES